MDQKLIRGRKLRIDTTVVESDIHHPTDARLLQDSIKVITRTVKEIKETGAAIRTEFHDRNRSVKKRVLNISKVAKRRTGEAVKEIDKITTKIIATAETVIEEASGVLKNAYHKLWRDGEKASRSTKQLVEKLTEQLQVAQRIID
ncbi:MAG: hypothetical protein QME73_00725 [Bacillota bacterium]|nr:hypothetical protein [Bacillota bacterium]